MWELLETPTARVIISLAVLYLIKLIKQTSIIFPIMVRFKLIIFDVLHFKNFVFIYMFICLFVQNLVTKLVINSLISITACATKFENSRF